VAAASAASEPYRDEARKRGVATVAAMKGELEPPKKSHKLRNLLVLLGLAGLAAFAYKKFAGSEGDSAWKSSYEPTPAPPPTAPSRPTAVPDPETDDAAAAAPDEALADAAEQPHSPTNPDTPLENRNLS
jgi:hypothetical protein